MRTEVKRSGDSISLEITDHDNDVLIATSFASGSIIFETINKADGKRGFVALLDKETDELIRFLQAARRMPTQLDSVAEKIRRLMPQ